MGAARMTWLVLLLAHASPEAAVARDRVDLVEVNHFYDDNGRLVFDQVLFYDWCDEAGRFQVRAWRLLKLRSQWPVRDARGGYTCTWHDGEKLRHVRAAAFRETWGQHDPELIERAALPREHRRELGR